MCQLEINDIIILLEQTNKTRQTVALFLLICLVVAVVVVDVPRT